ncbi:HEAT repeat domain-containing protein [Dactylosporangium salmoneum]|uniref:HEAT repeat protein n=1 Tax=Dactylosporangium salmoneum TaxID=53361 RepID=A0ABN3HDK5_9ACTN
MALYERLRDALRDPDPAVRLDAARRAGEAGDHRLVDALLRAALTDGAEVRVAGGLGETFEHAGDAAAVALGEILARRGGIDERVAGEVTDPAHDDDRVATLLYYLGPRYEPLRQRLEAHPDPRVRLRAARAVLSIHRTAAYAAKLLADPSPLLRLEGLQVPAGVRDDDVCLRLMAGDPAPEVRAGAALLLRFAAIGVEPFVAAVRSERDPGVRAALLACLAHRRRDPEAVRAMVGLLGDAATAVRKAAAEALRDAGEPGVAGPAIGLRVLAEPDEGVLAVLLRYRPLLQEAPQLRPVIERLHRYANFDGDRHALGALLSVPQRAAGAARAGGDAFLREVARQAADAAPTPQPGMAEMADAVAAHDAERAMTAGEMVAYQVALEDPAHEYPDPVRGPTTAARRALLLTRAAHALAARLLAAGVQPPVAAPIVRLLLPGEDPVEALRSVLGVEECRRARNVTWLRLLMRPADETWYLEQLRAASPQDPPSEIDVADWHLELAVAAAEGRRTR